MNTAQRIAFFFDNAGSSYRPGKESQFAGRLIGAMRLAAAEEWAEAQDAVFEWETDLDSNSADFSDERPAWDLWQCLMYMRCAECPSRSTRASILYCSWNHHHHVRASLHGVDFGRDGYPTRQNYGRVVEAELALEAMTEYYPTKR